MLKFLHFIQAKTIVGKHFNTFFLISLIPIMILHIKVLEISMKVFKNGLKMSKSKSQKQQYFIYITISTFTFACPSIPLSVCCSDHLQFMQSYHKISLIYPSCWLLRFVAFTLKLFEWIFRALFQNVIIEIGLLSFVWVEQKHISST